MSSEETYIRKQIICVEECHFIHLRRDMYQKANYQCGGMSLHPASLTF
jgi:hypothetical protein